MKAAVLGATGYTGMILLRILSEHPEIRTLLPVSSSVAGSLVSESDPGLDASLPVFQDCGGKFLSVEEAAAQKPDVVFAALPHLASAEFCAPFFGKSVVIDLSADFRIKDHGVFFQAYGQEPPRPDLLAQAVYGLCDWNPEAVKSADIIANPGCYPTSALVPLLPLAKAGRLKGAVIINSLSGISGAGKKVHQNYLYVERTENAGAYSPGSTHRHWQEIKQELSGAGFDNDLLFNPHLAPMKRGMNSTMTLFSPQGPSEEEVRQLWLRTYAGRPFVRVLEKSLPQTAHVWGSNRLDMAVKREGDFLQIFSVIDNLIKGASGQAVQNMNLRFGLPEEAGLSTHSQV